MMSASTEAAEDDKSNASEPSLSLHDRTGTPTVDALKVQNREDGATRCFERSKLVVLLLVATIAAVAGTVTCLYTSNNEEDDFESQVDAYSFEIAEAVQSRAKNLFVMMSTLAVTLSSHAKTTEGTTWPFETFPNFENVVSNYRRITGSRMIATIPLVSEINKSVWEDFSVENQGWIKESYEAVGISIDPLNIRPTIFDIENGHATEAFQGPFLPVWQISAPPRNTGVINFNVLSNSDIAVAAEIVTANNEAVFTKEVDINFFLDDEHDQSTSLLIQPILEDATDVSSATVASIMATVSWETFFTDLVREDNQGMVCVLKNTCGDETTWKLSGTTALMVGQGDHHDQEYNRFEQAVKLTPFSTIDIGTPGYCEYQVSIYPTSQIEDDYKTNRPAVYTSVMVLLFVFSAAAFLVYDVRVQRRQREAVDSAARSNAIVSSLFPVAIRDRLFKGNESRKDKNGNMCDDPDATNEELLKSVPEAQKFRLKNYLDEEDEGVKVKSKEDSVSIQDTKPIADLFPNTTVMFADIAGFTAWSSVREPSQVFTLLETVYKAFDKTAKRRRVFKVETVGDCYVAVTGLPEPLKDHASVMCQFARDCLGQFNVLVRQLEVVLGPDTGDLAMRLGLHSGPVTAGVLRGEKSRFQLFGDTVNTAARIESTGTRNKIHLSHETADLLHQVGKSNWLRKRNETVMAKGKGEMQTYWLLTDEELASGTIVDDATKTAAPLPIVKANAPRLANRAADVLDPEASLPPRIKRLVDWNVDVLKRLLKQIVANRNATEKEKMDTNHPLMMKMEVNIGCDTYVLDEVTEIIRLPGYDKHLKTKEDPNKVELPKEVEVQLRLYVSSIAAMHRDNPFHNFEHASHVMMSVSKLLSRIVAPDEVLKGDDTEDKFALSLHDHTYGITSDPLTQFSVVLAALIHDVDHSGVSNFQLIKEDAKIASVFKNKSVAEQNSIVLAWDRLMESRFTVLRSFIYSDPDELKRFRQLMVNTVLATDIFDKELGTLRKNRWDTAFRHISQQVDSSQEDDVNRKATIVIEHLIQASDVAHTMQHWHIYQKWNERLFSEMTVAFQTGRSENNPADGWYKGELGFFDNYVIPLAKKLKECGVFGVSSDEYLNYALENRREWASKGEEAVERMDNKYSRKEEEAKPESASSQS